MHKPIKPFLDDRGWSYHDIFGDVVGGQVNYSVQFPGVVKAWHRHKKQTDYFCVLMGNIRVATHDSETGETKTYFMGEQNPSILKVPPGLWHGFTCLGDKPCGLLYFMTERYDPDDPDEERAPWDSFGYNWFPENR